MWDTHTYVGWRHGRLFRLAAAVALLVLGSLYSPADDILDELDNIESDDPFGDLRPKVVIHVQVEPPPAGKPPRWPVGIPFDSQPKRFDERGFPLPRLADAYVWVPDDADHVRAVLLITPEADCRLFGEQKAVRAVAEKHGMAILYLQNCTSAPQISQVESILESAAKWTKKPSFKHAPWITFNRSMQPEFGMALGGKRPSRTVATIAYHAPAPEWPPPDGRALVMKASFISTSTERSRRTRNGRGRAARAC